ncbi:MAG: flagellar basal body-associated FliL family protein [Deltaproteobacteria bacterium]|jgi:flagellar FliL protein|nr:flagellar basal body-associated FliL family protein [Deltaproteobacteria bacterium]MBW2582496.1 flagellar basal body-associated FliL family protein [Deltaproteobacteria bacterium]
MSNKILVLLIGVMMMLILGLGGGLFMMWNQLSALNAQSVADAGGQPDEVVSLEQSLGPIFSLDTFIVNLADKGGTRYLRVTMDLELGNSDLEDELYKRLPQVRDSLLMILPSKRFEDISTVQGKTALRDEMLEALNGYLGQGKITNIYYKEFVVQ